jgi:ferrous-iron efflux pump FieF
MAGIDGGQEEAQAETRAEARAAARPASAEESARLMRSATYASVSVAGTLIVIKTIAWLQTGSVSMLGTLVDSILDAAASIINLFAVRHALTPADEEHRFGHGKAEALAGLGQAAFIAGSAVFLLFEAVNRLIHPQPVVNSTLGIVVLVFSIVATLGLVGYQRFVVKRTNSLAIDADSFHYKGDLLVNLGVIAALAVSQFMNWPYADSLFALTIGAYIMYGAWNIFVGAYDQLMDREMSDEVRAQIRAIVMAHEQVREMHDLRTRTSGTDSFIQLHLELDGDMRLHRAHDIADEVEAEIRAAFPAAEVIIHQDPAELDEEHQAFRE